ncbi:TPA: hypothetical protein SMT52_001401 [Proteus mirabilis]|nr:hypothetical protein [Proteus mirabilis]
MINKDLTSYNFRDIERLIMNQLKGMYITPRDLIHFLNNQKDVIIKSSNNHADLDDFCMKIISCEFSEINEIDIIEINGAYLCNYDNRSREWVKLEPSVANASYYRNSQHYFSYQVPKDILFNLQLIFLPEN